MENQKAHSEGFHYIPQPKETSKPKFYRLVRTQDGVMISLFKVTRKRYIKIAMALGVPAREAEEMAAMTNEQGISYKEGLSYLVRVVHDVTDKEYVRFWTFMWHILGI